MSLGFKNQGAKIIMAIEKDKDIAYSYQKNHKETIVINEDITKIKIETVFEEYKNKIDVVIGGPP